MQLAEALLLGKELKKRVPVLKDHLLRRIQETDRERRLKEYLDASDELTRLYAAINRTNAESTIETKDGVITVAEALTRREYLKDMVQLYQGTATNSHVNNNNSTQKAKNTPPDVAVIDAKALQNDIEMFSRELRAIIITIQRANWTVELKYYTPSQAASDLVGA